MNKLAFSDILKNYKLFFGTFISIFVTTCIISACLNLVFSSVATFDKGHRFDAMDIVVMKNQNITNNNDSKTLKGIVPLSQHELDYFHNKYNGIADYSFYVSTDQFDTQKIVGHNISSMKLSEFQLKGEKPSYSQIVVDENFAKKNNLVVGDTIKLKTNNGNREYNISGISESNISGIYDLQNYIFFHDEMAKRFSLGSFSIGIETNNPDALAQKIKSKGYTVLTGKDKGKAELPSIINNDISLMVIFITMGSVCLVISMFVISGAMKFLLQNRFGFLALLRVIGLTKSQIKRLLIKQTLLIGILGTISGTLLSMPVSHFIIKIYQKFGIVEENFNVIHSWLGNGAAIVVVLVVTLLVTAIVANKPLSVPPASAIKNEKEFTSKTSAKSIIIGVLLFLGAVAILIFTPMTNGIGIGMAFCACSLLLGSMICLAPLIIKILNRLLSLVVKRFGKSLGQVAYANINMKASKFAIASISIAIMMSMGNVMLLNNITYMDSTTKEKFYLANQYNFVSTGLHPYEVKEEDKFAMKDVPIILHNGNKLEDVNALAVQGDIPNVDMVKGSKEISNNKILIADTVKNARVGGEVEISLEDGSTVKFIIGGIYHIDGIQEEIPSCIIPYNTLKNSFYDNRFDYVYSHVPVLNSVKNKLEFYNSSPAYDTQLGASLLLGSIGMILSIVALFNTFATIMSVRKKEFSGLKVLGARKGQLIKMTIIEILIITATGLITGFGILVMCVGSYSLANIGVFDFIVNKKLYYSTIIISAILSVLAGLIPSISTIMTMKKRFRVE